MNVATLALGCLIGWLVGAVTAVLALGLCRAAATGDPESDHFQELIK